MSESCNHNCGSCSSDCASREEQDFRVAQNSQSNVKHVIGVVSGKGGVGKSLVTSLLATAVAKEGYKVAVLDADITGPSIPKMFGTVKAAEPVDGGMTPAESVGGIKFISINSLLPNQSDPVIWRGPVVAQVVQQFWKECIWGEIDYMFVDMPPGTGDVPLTVFQSLPLDGIVIVTSPQELVEMIVGKAVNMAGMMNVPIIGLVENMAYFECPNCNEKHYIFGNTDVKEIAERFGIAVTSEIPMNPKVAKLCDQSKVELADTTPIDSMVDAVLKLEK